MKPIDELVEAVARALALDEDAIARRKAFLEFTDEDVGRLKALHEALKDLPEEFAKAFYDHLLRFEETRRLIPDAQTLERLRKTQAQYFDRLTAGDYGWNYIQHRLRVGIAHERVGLAPAWYVGAYGKYLSGLLPEIWRRLGSDPASFVATVQALTKIVLLDMSLAIDTYIEADRRTILALKAYAEMVFASIPFGLVVLSPELTVLSANQSFLERFGLVEEGVRGRPLETVVAAEGLVAHAREVLDSGIARQDVRLDMGAVGQPARIPVRVTLAGICLAEEEEEEEEEARLLMVVEDITERKQAEEMLARLGRILDNSSNEIYVFDGDTLRFVQVNQGAQQNLGYTPDELESLTPLDLKPEFDRRSFEDLIAPLRRGERDTVTFETVHKRKDGSLYPVEVRLHFSRTETPPVFVAIIQDITERKQAEARIEQLAFYDSLTGLPNRALFLDRLKQSLAAAQRHG
ncbi:MAG: hypothetical protein DI596_14665, partial [Azospira oryzae]